MMRSSSRATRTPEIEVVAEAAHGFLDAPLVVEVRDAGLFVRRAHRRVDVVLDALFARRITPFLKLDSLAAVLIRNREK